MNTSNPNNTALALDLRTLELLQEKPTLNQRELAQKLGISLGKANYCLRALLAKGLVIAQNFKNNKNKLAYAYVLTPTGIRARVDLTAEFLQVKMAEFDRLRAEIEALQLQTAALNDQPSNQNTDRT